jgi:integrase
VWAGIRRAKGTAQAGKAPTLTADIRAMVAALPDIRLGLRDRALLLLGFAGAFRRSELVALDVRDLEVSRAGLVVTLRRNKTDQDGEGCKLGVPYGANTLRGPSWRVTSAAPAAGATRYVPPVRDRG